MKPCAPAPHACKEEPRPDDFDVLVVGSGLAGCAAALAAAEGGARVAVASAGPTFSGSSFFPGTWGMGLVGPRDDADAADLERTIVEVGRGVASPSLVHALVVGIPHAVARLDRMDAGLVEAHDADQRDFIPCFDHVTRCWHGVERAGFRAAVDREFCRSGVATLPHHELVDVCERDGRVTGAVLCRKGREMVPVRAGAVVLALGGMAGLYGPHALRTPDSCGRGCAVALAHGGELVNAEFLQIMPAIVEPDLGAVFNERTFRCCELEGFADQVLLDQRAGHGPLTARLADRAVDLAIEAAGPAGAHVAWHLPDPMPEFMRTYFDWFRGATGDVPTDGVRIAMRAQASNGGVLTGAEGRVAGGPEGLFACGEMAGGMHGADRLGGLSTANCLVFGHAAGRAAASAAATGDRGDVVLPALDAAHGASAVPGDVARLLGDHCLVRRNADGLARTARTLDGMRRRLEDAAMPCDDAAPAMGTVRARQALVAARALVAAMGARTESRGAHLRADFPEEDPAQARPQAVRMAVDGTPEVRAVDWDEGR